MSTETRVCCKCKETIYGSREREADGYRTWWENHYCRKINKDKK